MNIEELKSGFKQLQDGMNKIGTGSDFVYRLETLANAYDLLLNKYAPFKAGDRVQLSKTPRIDGGTAHGWLGSKHFLIQGAKGTVRSVEFNNHIKKLQYGVEFDDESYISSMTNKLVAIEPDRRHTYSFTDDFLDYPGFAYCSVEVG